MSYQLSFNRVSAYRLTQLAFVSPGKIPKSNQWLNRDGGGICITGTEKGVTPEWLRLGRKGMPKNKAKKCQSALN